MTTDTSGLAMSVTPGCDGRAGVGRLQHGSTNLDDSAGFTQRHNVRIRSADRIPESPMLDDQRFRLGYRESSDIPLGDAPEVAHRLPLRGDGAVRVEGEIRGESVRDKCTPLTADDGEPLFEWAQPVDHMTDHCAVVQLADRDDHILVLPTAAARGSRRHRRVLGAGYPGREIDVMGSQVDDHPDVADPRRKWPLPARGNLVDIAEFAGAQTTAEILSCRVVPLDV